MFPKKETSSYRIAVLGEAEENTNINITNEYALTVEIHESNKILLIHFKQNLLE